MVTISCVHFRQTGSIMVEVSTAVPPVAVPETSIVRLHGEACFYCGAVHTTLHPAGTVQTPVEGGVRVWPIVACGDCRPEARETAS
jgi:hypothetical protein